MTSSTATKKSMNRLKEHLDLMKQELNKTNKQIKQLENKNTTEWKGLDKVDGKSIDDLKQHENDIAKEIVKIQKEIKKSRSKSLLIAELSVLPAVFLLIFMSGITDDLLDSSPENPVGHMKTRYFTENLRGDTVDTWKSWRLTGTTLAVNILKSPRVTDHQLDVIHNAIASEKTVEFDDSIVHKGPKGTTSVYYQGWAGALKSASKEDTKYQVPTDFNFINSSGGEGDIIITLSNIKDSDGYTGYTKSVTEENEILKSFITIYDISNLTDDQLGTIVRHEFGHALGLGHSTATEDLMAPTIDMTIPYISECNVDAMADLYNANEGRQTVCEK
ncbi:matrixin family metalloprotease [Candidatus Nitrosotenuis chungbukensis]|uniref:matrixin family metalloprotease n=1 Tax=Candidatus Nitrosotenuis chungbukensis TaxID=1353246 RepID=UPI0026722F05|nr:matrixin family metalloprotease [Candidatus Nitrosotenuis chungbukensis]WKT58559.1 matrixin family metalloprotease [Candidatus Nitrosotenuis chungbukensis]